MTQSRWKSLRRLGGFYSIISVVAGHVACFGVRIPVVDVIALLTS